ncbi:MULTISPECIES: hypothetical protein [Aequorivita]|uniref:General stress protein CsbD n=1 Tax=Aequorivita iocasae TaxID=2803865 RepID=A0ABX7DQY1_9FLAO|nr:MULTISPECIES: hypothetical protein [Aequorivita]QQX76530.1 hypothetical protein JK629_14575 [Aequorivita iocasae]UCA56000.1 hypothetical protein LDL78_14645 [Aequorivita sp. F7]
MSEQSGNPKHSVGKGAQSEHHNHSDEESYVKNPENSNEEDSGSGGDYLEKKWRKIATDFQKKYKININTSEYKDESFSDTLKGLETTTGNSKAELEKEIKNWK